MWRNIENFSINNPVVSYRPTNHQYKMNFIYGTDITPSTIQNDSMFLSLTNVLVFKCRLSNAESLPQPMLLTRIEDDTNFKYVNRFRIHVWVKDGTGEANFFFFLFT
ncbi:unnamed protein product [Brassica rapa]|uniref:Replication protein A 70 kDa DNA-binding subunit B/D first OB fold domain-containing protein n=1 Tax=Brassica campestris TaxID=3711 RepID=A0A8D9I3Y8_BRACM|nr:unnamed protein product [Brassica rapa]